MVKATGIDLTQLANSDVREYIDGQFEPGEDSTNSHYWNTVDEGNRIAVVQEWLSPEIATILKKLCGHTVVFDIMSDNRSNK